MKPSRRKQNGIPGAGRTKELVLTTVGFTLLLAAIVSVIVEPIKLIAKYNLRIAKGSMIYELLSKEMEGAHVQTYLFNVTNEREFLSGQDDKLNVQEVGPFTYKELRSHKDLEVDEQAGVMRYSAKIRAAFLPEESIGDPRDMNISIPNIAMLAVASTVSSYPYWTKLGFNVLANRLNTPPIMNLPVQDFLWGYHDPFIALGNTLMPGFINFEKLGVLDRLYDRKAEHRFEVGATNADKFMIKKYNGCQGLKVWDYEDPSKRTNCNTFTDTYEGLAYPTDLTPKNQLRIYRDVFCRILELDYNETRTMEYGPEAYVYRFSKNAFTRNPTTDCLCGKMGCIDGVTDLSPCFYGLGVALSNAHFLHSDPKLYERIEGIQPDEKEHGSEILVDSKLGAVLDTRLTLQMSVVVKDVAFHKSLKQFSNMVVPIVYFKIFQPEMPDEHKNIYRILYIIAPPVMRSIEVLMFLSGLCILAYVARLLYWDWFCQTDFCQTNDRMTFTFKSVGEPLIEYDKHSIHKIEGVTDR